jgi:hypothetical protein
MNWKGAITLVLDNSRNVILSAISAQSSTFVTFKTRNGAKNLYKTKVLVEFDRGASSRDPLA